MGKCSACQENKCGGKYELRHNCLEPDDCTCTCQESSWTRFWKGAASIAGGAATVGAGVGLTLLTGGAAIAFGGGAIIGAGASMITNPISKKITGERMTGGDYLTDIGTGAVIGAASGGIGAGGSLLAKGASTAAKFGISVGAGAISGAAGGAIQETAKVIKGEEVSAGSFVKSTLIGAACGGVGSAAGQCARQVQEFTTNGVVKAATSIGTQAATAATTDATIQYMETGEVDFKRVAMTATSSAVVASTAEISSGAIKKTDAYTNKVNKDLVTEAFPNDPEKQKKVLEGIKEANQLPKAQVEVEAKKVSSTIEKNPQEVNNLAKEPKTSAKGYRPSKHGSNNIHLLTGDRIGQAAADIPDVNGKRGAERIIMDLKPDMNFYFADHTDSHDYKNTSRPDARPHFEPFDALHPEQMRNKNLKDDDEKKND